MKWLVYTSCFISLAQWTCSQASGNNINFPSTLSCKPVQKTYEITLSKPDLVLTLTTDSILKSSSIVVIRVKEVTNPEQLPVTIDVNFINATHKWVIGNFSLYPADRPGEFRLRIPNSEDIATTLRRGDIKEFSVELKLQTKNIKKTSHSKLSVTIVEPLFMKG